MTITSNLTCDPECHISYDDGWASHFRVTIWLEGFHNPFEMGGKTAGYVYEKCCKGDRVTIFLNKNDLIYKAKIENEEEL